MQRRKPSSAKQKKAQLQQKRAIKRGDVSPPPAAKPDRRRKGKGRGASHTVSDPDQPGPSARAIAAADSSRRLQSSFVKLPKEFLEETKRLAANLPLPRPVPAAAAIWTIEAPIYSSSSEGDKRDQLTCPKRPKWRYEMTKKEVEKNEEGLFKKWIDQTDSTIGNWCSPELKRPAQGETETPAEEVAIENEEMPKAPTSFERNLEVWRQLWRVTEISQIILILLDSRCPLLHYPPSLAAYLSSPAFARKRTILVLTKVDISGPVRADAWTKYLNTRYPELRVVQVEAYAEKSSGRGAGGRHLYDPHLPSAFRQTLVDALKETHAELLLPPGRIRDVPEKVQAWKPPVKRDIDWEVVLQARGGQVGSVIGGAAASRPKGPEDAGHPHGSQADEDENEVEPEFLTIGLIGQPNVGKSSLLNALFGTQKVRASRTPGKTKHFQTLFWTSQVRLVDCPGLVMPNLVPMETQVLCGILPISRVSAVPLCIYHAARLLPLEIIFDLSHPSLAEPAEKDKRTWREPRPDALQASRAKSVMWTAMDILTALALKKGWLTAKAGRPDVNRAGNFILRSLAEGKVKWAFWPPDTDQSVIERHQTLKASGIWIPYTDEEEIDIFDHDDGDSVDGRSEASEGDQSSDDAGDPGDERVSSSEEEDSDEEEDASPVVVRFSASRFDALMVRDDGDDEDSDEEDKWISHALR